MPNTSSERVDIARYARQVVANGWIVVLFMAAVGGAAYVRANAQSRVYASSAVVRVFDRNDAPVGGGTPPSNSDPAREVEDELLYAQSPQVWTGVTDRLGPVAAGSIEAHAAQGSAISDTIRFTTESSTRDAARRATQTYVDVYLEQRRNAIAQSFDVQAAALRRQAAAVQEQIGVVDGQIAALASPATTDARQNLDLRRQSLTQKYGGLISTADQAEIAKLARQQTMGVVQAAAPPDAPVRPSPPRDAVVGCALGLLIGLGVVALRKRSRHRLTTSEDLAGAMQGLPFVTSIPFRRRPLHRRKGAVALDIVDGPNEVREAYRALRASLILGDLDHPIRSLLVTSAREREGTTTIAANIALSLAQAGERVVVVDCNLRTPALHDRFGISNDVGFSSLLTSPTTACHALQPVQVGGTHIAVLPAGPPPPDPADLFLGVQAAQAIRALTEKFRYVVLDCPPILSFADAMTLPWLVDGVLFVARADRTNADDVKQAELRLRQVSAPLLGAVLVGPRADRPAVPGDLDTAEPWSHGALNGTSLNGSSVKLRSTTNTAELLLDE